jgi:hypothetical protein
MRQLRRLPLTPRPINGEILSSWMARVSAVNGISIPELIEYAGGAGNSDFPPVDRDVPRPLIAGLALACSIPDYKLAEIDLRVQFPNAQASFFLPVEKMAPNCYNHSAIPIPYCHACFSEHERKGTTPFWKAEWTMAHVTRCPKHLFGLWAYCHHCLCGRLSVVAHTKHGGLVARCTSCYRAPAAHLLESAEKTFSRNQLVASMGQSLTLACRGLDPDPIWLGRINAATFLSVLDDMMWIFLDANLDRGFPLISRCAPATYYELAGIGLPFPSCPFNLLTFHHREMVIAAIAIALVGGRITVLKTCFPVPASELDAYPFSSIRRSSNQDSHSEIVDRIGRWPAPLKERALRYLPAFA